MLGCLVLKAIRFDEELQKLVLDSMNEARQITSSATSSRQQRGLDPLRLPPAAVLKSVDSEPPSSGVDVKDIKEVCIIPVHTTYMPLVLCRAVAKCFTTRNENC